MGRGIDEGQGRAAWMGTVAVCFAGAMICYLDRVGFPLAYTAMAQAAHLDKTTQGAVHSAFYNGYTFTQV